MELLAAVAIFFLYPALSMSGNSFRAVQIIMRRELDTFAESVCSHGFLTRDGYEDCISQSSNLLSNVRIEFGIRHTVSAEPGKAARTEGERTTWEEEISSSEIEEELWKNGIVRFQKGDYFTVVLTGKPSGLAGIPFLSGTDAGFRSESGGRIRDETESVCVDLS